jgi:hypothetical protein
MPKPRSPITITPVWRGDKIDVHVEGSIARVPAPADGLHFAIIDACHFFVDARTLWDDLDLLLDGKKVKKQF